MKTAQIRINKTPQIQEMLTFFQEKFYGLSESEITKTVLSLYYAQEKSLRVDVGVIEYDELTQENKKLYDELDSVPKSELYNI